MSLASLPQTPDARPRVALFRLAVREAFTRLGGAGWGRFGRVLSLFLLLLFGGWLIALRVNEGALAPTLKVPVLAARAATLFAAVPLALAVAHRRTLIDRAQGWEAMLLGHGLSLEAQAGARILAGVLRVAVGVALPALATGILSLVLAPNLPSVGVRALVLIVLLVQSLGVGVLLGTIAALCERASPLRGRSVLLVLLLCSAVAGELSGAQPLSLLGLLDFLFSLMLSAIGLGRLA